VNLRVTCEHLLAALARRMFRRAGKSVLRPLIKAIILCASTLLLPMGRTFAAIAFEDTSPYHHIRVVDSGGMRTLCFDDATESRMSLEDPLKGHFEYTEYFHMAWLWNAKLTNVLMIGLGGSSAQRSFEHYHPGIKIETIEIDPVVAQVARNYFHFKDSEDQKVRVEDGRVALRRSTAKQDLIILDAYVAGRYGSAIPQHLATKEFFELVRDHLGTNGIMAYNIIGSMSGWHADIVGAMYKTMKTVFPQVYVFRANTSLNLVLIATRTPVRTDLATLRMRADFLQKNGTMTLPDFRNRLDSFQFQEPSSTARSPILTDDFAPVEGLAASSGAGGSDPSRPSRPPGRK
jgi:spermidine synthase